ncbi:hypothetical protein GCK72_025634 [Caenorhabditis remanei]|uniref:Uncharacterized protein n=1 Tax=Caenorhabditis remanei TaxID=31234 RepID=A0A6A5G2I0_CAERE|nr:hypothetical protein GCK72_025634 [Caenorhabditis remanei]KAF1749167.1 hypothetical protein GCK72_025634 [Caenorhabditis remanei]
MGLVEPHWIRGLLAVVDNESYVVVVDIVGVDGDKRHIDPDDIGIVIVELDTFHYNAKIENLFHSCRMLVDSHGVCMHEP